MKYALRRSGRAGWISAARAEGSASKGKPLAPQFLVSEIALVLKVSTS